MRESTRQKVEEGEMERKLAEKVSWVVPKGVDVGVGVRVGGRLEVGKGEMERRLAEKVSWRCQRANI